MLHPGWQTGPKPRSGPAHRSGAWCITDTFSELNANIVGLIEVVHEFRKGQEHDKS
jgi:hypothetical protein